MADSGSTSLDKRRFLPLKREQTISAIADYNLFPEGLPPILSKSRFKTKIGALSTGTDKYLKKVFEHMLRKEDQDSDQISVKSLEQKCGFPKSPKARSRDDAFRHFQILKRRRKMKFFKVMKSETITGFYHRKKRSLVDYRNYQVAPGFL